MPILILVVAIIIIVVLIRKNRGCSNPNLEEKFANNELIQDYIKRQSSSFIDQIRRENKDGLYKDIKVNLYIGICESGIDYIGGSYRYAVDFEKNHLKPLNKHSERQTMANVIVEGILQKVKAEMPINFSHSNPNFKVIKNDNEYFSGDPKLVIVYTATNKNYIEPKSW